MSPVPARVERLQRTHTTPDLLRLSHHHGRTGLGNQGLLRQRSTRVPSCHAKAARSLSGKEEQAPGVTSMSPVPARIRLLQRIRTQPDLSRTSQGCLAITAGPNPGGETISPSGARPLGANQARRQTCNGYSMAVHCCNRYFIKVCINSTGQFLITPNISIHESSL